ncbi:hypothetical protein DdX_20326 [Ditylenchus destructor]|uniref:Uncharacterized protein n=1 Tax=Ditylenchus destructor TaxID=166010 RepID=A0AAD4QWA3_9BILA|nr:hypothetical protein DdX_20326 [Ditylenchus destructor]
MERVSYSFAEMRPYLGPTVRIKKTYIYVAGHSTYNAKQIEEMESIAYLWRDGNINIENKQSYGGRIVAEDFQLVLNSPTILQCQNLCMDNAHFSFKDYKAFSSAVSPNPFTIVFVKYGQALSEFQETNKTSREKLELKKGLPSEYQDEYLKKYDSYKLERSSVLCFETILFNSLYLMQHRLSSTRPDFTPVSAIRPDFAPVSPTRPDFAPVSAIRPDFAPVSPPQLNSPGFHSGQRHHLALNSPGFHSGIASPSDFILILD